MSQKKDRRIVQSEQAIIEAGISALLVNPSAGMSEIAQTAGVGRATLYRHFESREALIRKLVMVCSEETEIALEPYAHLRGKAALEAVIDVLVPMADRFRFLVSLWSLVEDDEEVKRINAEMLRDLHALIDQAKRAGDVHAQLPTAWLVTLLDSMLTAGWMFVETGTSTSREAAEYVKQSFFHGCGPAR